MIQGVLPHQAGCPRNALDIQKDQGFLRLCKYLLIARRVSIALDVIQTQEPGGLRIRYYQLAALVLNRRMTQCHIVRHRKQFTGFAQDKIILLPGPDVLSQHDTPIRLLVDILQHLALSTAGGALMQDNDLIVIGCDYFYRGSMRSDPSLLLAYVQQHPVYPLFRAGTRIKIIRVYLMDSRKAVMHHHLPAVKMRVPKGRSQKQQRPGFKSPVNLVDIQKFLEIR